jgi:uncharacterized protein (DUF362 family)
VNNVGTILDPGAWQTAAAFGPPSYDAHSPFRPGQAYPELPFAKSEASGRANSAYDTVRTALRLLKCDDANAGTARWNPLSAVIRPGDFVLLKPNLVREFRETHGHHADCTVTHGAVIRAVLDYVFLALGGRGRIVIADAPHSDCDFDAVARITGLREIQELYRREMGFEVEVYDLRPECAVKIDGVIVDHRKLPGDPAGYAKVDLAEHSMFREIETLCHRLYGSEYDTAEIVSHHRDGRHEFLISRTVLAADVVVSLPKLKTHKKTGVTVNMKNLVGINGNKNWLPHHREGTPTQGGDQFADEAASNRIERGVMSGFRRVFPLLGPLRPLIAGPIKTLGKRIFGDTNTNKIRSGNWHGNDTTWRMVIDLNRALHYSDADGVLHDRPMRRFFSLVDGIISGEGNGPLDPLPKPAGLVLAGWNPVAVDVVAARLMGFDWRRLKMLTRALDSADLPLVGFACDQLRVASNRRDYDGALSEIAGPGLGFRPHFGWIGNVEFGLDRNEAVA